MYSTGHDHDGAHANCSVFGVFNGPEYASQLTYYGLHAQQHRGQESAGILSLDVQHGGASTMHLHKGMGLVLDVFNDPTMFSRSLPGFASIGHTRYSTCGGDSSLHNIQPFKVSYRNGNLALVHNGNLSNERELRRRFVSRGTLFQSSSDSELFLHLMAQATDSKSQIDELLAACAECEGAYSLVVLTDTCMYAARDPNGFRPLVLGRLGSESTRGGPAYCVASESCAFDLIGATFIREIEPGEVLAIDTKGCVQGGKFRSYKLTQKYGLSPCVFEYIYFSRPDSLVFGEYVDTVRHLLGAQLARENPPPVSSDQIVIVPVPDSSNTAALGYAKECNRIGIECAYDIGLVRNHYVGRTFIAPNQNSRELKVRCKFNVVKRVIQGKIVVLVDDSIVRGTTSKQLIKMVRDAGAKEVHFRVSSPPVISPCYYGMDFPSREELMSFDYPTIALMTRALGADSLGFLSEEGLQMAVSRSETSASTFCKACFTAQYPVPIEKNSNQSLSW